MEKFTIIKKEQGNISIEKRNIDVDFYGLDMNRKVKRLKASNNIELVDFDCHHLCWDCSNGYPTKCLKISDRHKRRLEEYSFIEEGIQIFTGEDENDLYKLLVTRCKNFTSAKVKTNGHR